MYVSLKSKWLSLSWLIVWLYLSAQSWAWRSWALCLEGNKHEKGRRLKMKLYKQRLKKWAVWFGAGIYVPLGTHVQRYNVKIRKKDLGVILKVGLWTKSKKHREKILFQWMQKSKRWVQIGKVLWSELLIIFLNRGITLPDRDKEKGIPGVDCQTDETSNLNILLFLFMLKGRRYRKPIQIHETSY